MFDPHTIGETAKEIVAFAGAIALAWQAVKPIIVDIVKMCKGGASKKAAASDGEKKPYSWIPVFQTAFYT